VASTPLAPSSIDGKHDNANKADTLDEVSAIDSAGLREIRGQI